MNQRTIILIITTLFIASSIWLFAASERHMDPDRGKDWWALSFIDPKGAELDFKVENHSENADFSITVLSGANKISESREMVEKTKEKEITLDERNISGRKIIIRVTHGQETREIYKNL